MAKTKRGDSIITTIIKENTSLTRKNIKDWMDALSEAGKAENPKQRKLQEIYDLVSYDALLSSQTDLRIDRTQAADFRIVDVKGKQDDGATDIVRDTGLYDTLTETVIESRLYGCTLAEISLMGDALVVETVPRRYVSPATGLFFPDLGNDKGISYRELPEYGTWLLEFNYNRPANYGTLSRVVSHVLMKRFAQACWSEYCEICGIPPRVLKTDATSPEMLERAETMMRAIGTAAWFIIDTSENFEFAPNSTIGNGDTYKNFIQLCNNEITMAITGAILGQDTVNGNRSKEESSAKIAQTVILADQHNIEVQFNRQILPALSRIGLVREGLRIEIARETNVKELWDMTYQAGQLFEVDPEWVRSRFGIEVTGVKQPYAAQLQYESEFRHPDFFD
jgi:hypothetical protein